MFVVSDRDEGATKRTNIIHPLFIPLPIALLYPAKPRGFKSGIESEIRSSLTP